MGEHGASNVTEAEASNNTSRVEMGEGRQQQASSVTVRRVELVFDEGEHRRATGQQTMVNLSNSNDGSEENNQ